MRLLFDENLSPRLSTELAREFPSSAHVRDFNLQQADDAAIWDLAREYGYMLVSKDDDFHQRSFLYGHPPKVIWIRAGNRSTEQIAEVLRRHAQDILAFEADPDAAFLAIA